MCGDEKPENGFHAQSNSSLLSLSWRKFLSQAILPWVHSLLRKCWWTSSKDWSHKSSQAACTCTTTSGYLDIIRCRMYNGLSIVHVFVKVTLSFSSVPFPGKCFLLLVCGDFWRIVVFAFLLFLMALSSMSPLGSVADMLGPFFLSLRHNRLTNRVDIFSF